MAIGHHIGECVCQNSKSINMLSFLYLGAFIAVGDQSHTIEKQRNVKTKEMKEHQEFVNLNESK